MCWIHVWKSEGGGFSWRGCPVLYPKPCPSWLNVPTPIGGVWAPLCVRCPRTPLIPWISSQNARWCLGLWNLVCPCPFGLHWVSYSFWSSCRLMPITNWNIYWLRCQLCPPFHFSPHPLANHSLFHILQISPFPTSPPQDSWTILRQMKAEDGGSLGFLLLLPTDLKIIIIKKKRPLWFGLGNKMLGGEKKSISQHNENTNGQDNYLHKGLDPWQYISFYKAH